MSQLAVRSQLQLNAIESLADLAFSRLSASTQRNYRRALGDYWKFSDGKLDRSTLQRFIAREKARGIGPVAINQALAGIRSLVREAGAHGILESKAVYEICSVKGERKQGVRLGNWLTLAQVKRLLSKAKNIRERVAIGLMVGVGLRRAEVVGLRWKDLAERDGRLVAEVLGKGNKYRVVAVPRYVAKEIEAYRNSYLAPVIDEELIFEGRGVDWVYWVIQEASEAAGVVAKPHDLRRTWAAQAKAAGAKTEQIQMQLGHASVRTTELYLNTAIDLRQGHAAADLVDMESNEEI